MQAALYLVQFTSSQALHKHSSQALLQHNINYELRARALYSTSAKEETNMKINTVEMYFACTHMHVCTHTRTEYFARAHKHTRTHTRTHAHTHTHTQYFAHAHVHIHTHTHLTHSATLYSVLIAYS